MTREEAIEMVEMAFAEWENEFSVSGDDWSKEHEALDMAVKALEGKDTNVPTKWIPISEEMSDEKLPKDFRRVQITVVNYAGDKVVRTAIYIKLRRQFRVEGSSNFWDVGEKGLLAWMELPEPYTESVVE